MKDAKGGQLMLARLGDVHRNADKFQLFRTAQDVSRIQRELIRFKDSEEDESPERARRLITRIERAQTRAETEHEDVALSNNSAWRSRRGLIAACGLFAAQLTNLVILLVKPETLTEMPDILRDHVNTLAGWVILALASFPIRDFIFVYRFNRIKEDCEKVLTDLKKELLVYLGSLKKETP